MTRVAVAETEIIAKRTEAGEDELLYQSQHTRVYRHRLHTGASILCKELLGVHAEEQLLHERMILERLAGTQGVPRLAAGAPTPHVLALEDPGGVPLLTMLRVIRLAIPALLELALQLTQILALLHRRGVLHKNINPATIVMCGPQDGPLFLDFRLATIFSEEQPGFTHHREIAGTLAYLAPEQTGRTGRSVDQRADLYALGATLYEIATGRPPFTSEDPLQLIHDHLARVPTPPSELKAHLPQGLSDILLRLLEKEPDHRYQSAEGLAHDLTRLAEGLERGEQAPFKLGERDFALRLSAPSRLIGRQAELAALQAALADARSGKSQGLLVAGAPGVGKTALLNELRPLVTAQRGWFVTGKCDQYRNDTSAAVVQALRALGRLLLAEPEMELAPQRARIRQALGNNAGLLTAVLPEFELLLGAQPQVAASEPIEAEAKLRQAAVELLRAVVSPARPLVMVLDDLQWASPISIRLFDALLVDESLRGLLVVGAYREAEVDAIELLSAMMLRWQRLGAAPRLLRLQNLPPMELAALLSEMLRLPLLQAASLADAVGARTHGNPYETVELVNGLRRVGALLPCEEGWVWDPATIHRYVGQESVVELLTARIGRLPRPARALLETMACLGGELKLGLLHAATDLTAAILEELLALSLAEGLVVLEQGEESIVRFRHDRVQQAVYSGLDAAQQRALHLTLARRLAVLPELADQAAEQYLPACAALEDPAECRRVITLFRATAEKVRRSTNFVTVEHYLGAALALLSRIATGADAQVLVELEIAQHAALYSLGRLEEADRIYRAIELHCSDPRDLAEATCLQISSLTNRDAAGPALALGFGVLRQLGAPVPAADFAATLPGKLEAFCQWVETLSVEMDVQRPEIMDRRVIAKAKLANQMMSPAVCSDPSILTWLVLDSQRLWAEHGPCAALVFRLSHAIVITIGMKGDYRTGHRAMRHVLAVSEARGYEPASSQARYMISLTALHWFEPLENGLPMAWRAREGLLQGGDLQLACFTHYSSITALLHTAPTHDSFASEIESSLVLAQRTGNPLARRDFSLFKQFLGALRGHTATPGSFTDDTFDEEKYLESLATVPLSSVSFHIMRGLSAAVFDDAAGLARHANAMVPFLPLIQSFYLIVLAYLLQALALANRIKAAAPLARAPLLAELDACRDWFALRVQDAPSNFLYLFHLVEAERAWAVGEYWVAAGAFDAAQREVEARPRMWHQALIVERAGLFHLAHGLSCTARMLLAEARGRYAAWGASAKVRELERTHAFLRSAPGLARRSDHGPSLPLSADGLDLLGVLRASQLLSSETSIERLKVRLGELLGRMTGATSVLLVVRRDATQEWFLPATAEDGAVPVAVEEAGARLLLPLAAFRYAERTREPLLVEDATRDDRFARDPYLVGRERCSLLVVPILNQGHPRAMLLLENHLSRGSFSVDRLDAVKLITGQLAVSIDNALLYASLEQKVADRTRELAHSLALLNSTHKQLLDASRRDGMAEIATNVLHNVGNVLNSVNVSANLVAENVKKSKVPGLSRAAALLREHAPDLATFLSADPRGKQLPTYLSQLAEHLLAEQKSTVHELDSLRANIDHIKEIVAMQQSYAKVSGVKEILDVRELVEDSLRMNASALERHGLELIRDYAKVPPMNLDKHRILQILVNLVRNAKYACDESGRKDKRLTIRVRSSDGLLRISVIDNGVGIPPENLTRIFNHGFSTRVGGHGFGLHSGALAAKEMGGSLTVYSGGIGLGAAFTLELPGTSQEDSHD